jgi:S1-C subfamily serine protease
MPKRLIRAMVRDMKTRQPRRTADGMTTLRSHPMEDRPARRGGLLAAAVGAVIALARGGGTPTTTSIVAPSRGSIGAGVVLINTDLAFQGAAAAGTGMVLTPSGKVLTNNHVISGATTIDVVVPNTGTATRRGSSAMTAPPTSLSFSFRVLLV